MNRGKMLKMGVVGTTLTSYINGYGSGKTIGQLISNGDFNGDSTPPEWTWGVGWSWLGAGYLDAKWTPTVQTGTLSQSIDIIAGETYRVQFLIVGIFFSADYIRLNVSLGGGVAQQYSYADGTGIKEANLVAGSNDKLIRFWITRRIIDPDDVVIIDSVGVWGSYSLSEEGSVNYEIHAADSAMQLYDNVVAGDEVVSGTLTDLNGRVDLRHKVRAGWLGVVLKNDTVDESFALEKIGAEIEYAGRLK